jgi:hypothetical protein
MIWTSDELRRCRANGCHLMLDVRVVIVEAEWRFRLHSGFRMEKCSRRKDRCSLSLVNKDENNNRAR